MWPIAAPRRLREAERRSDPGALSRGLSGGRREVRNLRRTFEKEIDSLAGDLALLEAARADQKGAMFVLTPS